MNFKSTALSSKTFTASEMVRTDATKSHATTTAHTAEPATSMGELTLRNRLTEKFASLFKGINATW